MSIRMLMTGRRSVRGDVKRPTTARDAAGETRAVWPGAVTAQVRGFPTDITTDVARRVFGEGVRADVRWLVPLTADIQELDGVTLLDGPLAGQRYRVTKRNLVTGRPRLEHAELALASTTEVF